MRRFLEASLMLAMGACSAPTERGTTWGRRADSLAGSWDVQFTTRPDVLWPSRSAKGLVVRGSMTLIVNRALRQVFPRVGTPTNYGMYDVDFSSWGFVPAGNRPPAVVVAPVSVDSIAFLFDTDRPAFAMTMVGRMSRDTIRGEWQAIEGRGVARRGSFRMTRPSAGRPTPP